MLYISATITNEVLNIFENVIFSILSKGSQARKTKLDKENRKKQAATSSHWRCSVKQGALKNFINFTGKYM